jgi:putative hydrolase of HD superfamily
LNTQRIEQQIAFILEIDRLKSILRRSYLLNETRHENTAEHSWHLAVMALVLAEHASAEVNTLQVLKMLLVHDIVEIDSGDTYIYDAAGNDTKAERENAAARRIFGLLPPDQEAEITQLWQEFEARETPEAKFAAALDRLMPLLHNYHTEGRSWREHGISESQVMSLNSHMNEGSQTLWDYAEALIKDATAKGYLREENEKDNGNPA